jgi:hypothetical protein
VGALAARFHALQQSLRSSPVDSKIVMVANLLQDYKISVTFAVANVRAIEKLAKKFAKVVKFPLKDVVFMHMLQTQTFARTLAPAAAVEHLNVLLLLAQDASRSRLNLPAPLNALLASSASTTTCGGCRAAMPAKHMVLACGHTRCPTCFSMCRQLGMTKLLSQRHNINVSRDASIRLKDVSAFLCDACSHTFLASADDCMPTHATIAFLGARGVSRQRISRMSTKSSPRLQVKDGDSSFEDDDKEDAKSAADDTEACDADAFVHKTGRNGEHKADVCSLSEAAFYMSDGCDAGALKRDVPAVSEEAGNVDADDADGRGHKLQ